MTIRPTAGVNRSWYSLTTNLECDSAAKDYPTLVRRIQKFDRDSILLMISVCTWFAATLPEGDARDKSEENMVFDRYSHFIGALAFIFCTEQGMPAISEVELRILTGELFNIGWLEPDQNWFKMHEVAPIQARIRELANSNSYIEKIDSKDQGPLNSFLLMARIALIQWDGKSFSKSDWIRSAVIYEKYKELALSRGFCTAHEFESAERQFFGTTPDNLMKSVLLLITLFNGSYQDKSRPPGKLDLFAEHFPNEIEQKFNITNGDIGVSASRFAASASKLPEGKEALLALPPKAWLSAKEIWYLREFPLLLLDDRGTGRDVVSISPQAMFSKCARLLLFDVVQFFEKSNTFKAKQRAYDLKGAALEAYILDRAKNTDLVHADTLLPAGYSGKRPDFVWEGKDWTIFFEVKANVKMNSDQTYFNSASLVDSWKILTEPIDQCREYLAVRKKTPKRACLVIVTNDNLFEPMTSFKRVAKKWNFLDGSELDCLALLSPSQVETALAIRTPDEVGENLSDTWRKLDPTSVHAEVLDYDFFDAFRAKLPIPEFIEAKFLELFPGIDTAALR